VLIQYHIMRVFYRYKAADLGNYNSIPNGL